ncbi:hypothetical protein [Hymenobacter pini]|uniref:hypothetical protein n=1 Tax=Hymenobacter pini TaxID=2880879 RepID=UPI001CF2DCAA|nr:hypothetical protein [Hymenobacter pini]MCA8831949.1 hypothetical protein [Hymenobacter pini]
MPDSITDSLLTDSRFAPAPFTPRPLASPAGTDLAGYTGLFWLPVEDLLADPVMNGSVITKSLALRPGAAWLPLRVTQATIKFDEAPKQLKGATAYTTKVSALRALGADELAVVETMDNRRCLVMLREASGRLRLVGSRESFLTFRAGSEGSNPSSRAGLDLTFSGELMQRAQYYQGAFPVDTDTGAVDAAPGAGAGAGGGTVEIRNRKGVLIARVEAGKTVTISSGFRVALTISS